MFSVKKIVIFSVISLFEVLIPWAWPARTPVTLFAGLMKSFTRAIEYFNNVVRLDKIYVKMKLFQIGNKNCPDTLSIITFKLTNQNI